MTDDIAALPAEAAALFILSFRHRDELTAVAGRGGWRPVAARRAAQVERRFIASGAALAVVDGRGAFDEALGAIRALADPVEANAASLLVLLSRPDVERLADIFAAGATHYLASPFGDAELLQALRFAARASQRIGGGAIGRPALARAEALSYTFENGALQLNAALAGRLGVADAAISIAAAYRLLGPKNAVAARAARRRLKAGYGSTAFSHTLPDGDRVAHHLSVGDGVIAGLIEPLDGGGEGGLPLHRDPLTGLPDGSAARRRLGGLLGDGQRTAVLLVGLSRLQLVNSFYGRATGDVLIQAAARRMETAIADVPIRGAWLARLAGTEFLVACPECEPEALTSLAEALVSAVERRFAAAPDMFLIGADIGGATAQNEDAGALLRRASAALAEAREAPGGAVRLLDTAGDTVPRAHRLAEELRRAMTAGQIEIVFQPQVCVPDNRIDGVEALARWRHPEFGELGADALFGAARRARLIVPLSELIQQCALKTAAAWPADLGHLRLSINVTADDLASPRFAADMLARIAVSGFPAERVTAEVTEEGLIEDLAVAASLLSDLRRGGCRVAVDDFGTGYSSLAYLKSLPLDYLKLDRRLSQDIAGSPRGRIVVRSVIDMARSLGLGVIAEGVETEEQLALLAAEGCTMYQGFLCSGPVSADGLANLLDAERRKAMP